MSPALSEYSDALAATVQSASQYVVRVEGRRRLPATGIVWASDGIVVTAHQVVEHDDNIMLGLPDGRTVSAALVGRDPATDLAVLRAEASDLATPALAEPDQLQVGHLVLALGRPGQSMQAALGIVSVLGGTWHTSAGGTMDCYLQADVVMYPGFSGGPLVDSTGRVAGINSSALARGNSLTIPVPTIRRVADTLLAHGRVRRGYLGIGTQPVRLQPAFVEQVSQDTGLLLISIEPQSPAERHGLLVGDILVALDGHPVRHPDDLLAQLSDDRIGKPVLLRIVRGGSVQELTIEMGERA